MVLYLVQHGKSHAKEEDPQRRLTDTGRKDVRHIAETAKGYDVAVSAIRHSGKERARETAEIFAEIIGISDVAEIKGIQPTDDVEVFARGMNLDNGTMLVGHLPFMERLASYLITGSTDQRVIQFQNGCLICLNKSEDDTAWSIQWTLMPAIG